MTDMTRRTLCGASMSAALGLVLPAPIRAAAGSTAALKIDRSQEPRTIPADFIGLSYESQELQDSDFFSAANSDLVAKFRALGRQGTLRLGGDTVDYSFWNEDPAASPPPRPQRPFVVGDAAPDLMWRVTRGAIGNLRGFLDAIDWRCLYSLNLGTGTPDMAVDEARMVSELLGPRLLSFHIGNQPDRFSVTIRDPGTWTAQTYLQEWLPFARALATALPEVRIAMPDVSDAGRVWLSELADALANDPLRRHLGDIAHHYYVGGPPANPKITIANMLAPDPEVLRGAAFSAQAGRTLGRGWRMTEGNSCFLGGKPGVSDVFAASLWLADYALHLASLGYAGINIHGGSGEIVASSLGGLLPGESLMADPAAPHNRPFYTPIAGGPKSFSASPAYYGLLLASSFAGMRQVPLVFDPAGVNATAYGALAGDGTAAFCVINKDDRKPLNFGSRRFRLIRSLRAPSLISKEVSLEDAGPGEMISQIAPATAVILREA